jgi:hypothetical protein
MAVDVIGTIAARIAMGILQPFAPAESDRSRIQGTLLGVPLA